MAFPKLEDEQVERFIQQVAAYIGGQRETYRGKAVALSQNQGAAMHPFFPAATLESARVVVLAGERSQQPALLWGTLEDGFRSWLAAELCGHGRNYLSGYTGLQRAFHG
jgi:hypothetical protein